MKEMWKTDVQRIPLSPTPWELCEKWTSLDFCAVNLNQWSDKQNIELLGVGGGNYSVPGFWRQLSALYRECFC